jgi:hypothetical protein
MEEDNWKAIPDGGLSKRAEVTGRTRLASLSVGMALLPQRVGVGITITHDPLHGSGRAGFPHPALALGNNAHAAQRIGMTDRRQRQPPSDEAPHSIPENAAVLAPPRQRAMPRPADSESKKRQRRLVHGHSVVAKVSTLSTLRRRPRERLRMTQGRCGSLLHIRMTLSFTTPRRFNRRTGAFR